MRSKRPLINTLQLCVALVGAAGFVACDTTPELGAVHRSAHANTAYEIMDLHTATPETGADSVLAVSADLQDLPSTQELMEDMAFYSRPENFGPYYEAFASVVNGDPNSLEALEAHAAAQTETEKHEALLRLLVDGDRRLASGVFRGAISAMLVAGGSPYEVSEAFAVATGGRINVHFVLNSPEEGLVIVRPRASVEAGSAIDVVVHGNINVATEHTIHESALQSESAGMAPPPSGDETDDDGDDQESTTGATTAPASTTAPDSTSGQDTSGNTTVTIIVVNSDGNAVTEGNVGGTSPTEDPGNLLDFFWYVLGGAASGATVGGIVGTAVYGPGQGTLGGSVAGAGLGATLGAAYYFGGSGFWDDGSDFCGYPWAEC